MTVSANSLCVDMCIHMCVDMCADMCIHMRVDMCADMCVAMCHTFVTAPLENFRERQFVQGYQHAPYKCRIHMPICMSIQHTEGPPPPPGDVHDANVYETHENVRQFSCPK